MTVLSVLPDAKNVPVDQKRKKDHSEKSKERSKNINLPSCEYVTQCTFPLCALSLLSIAPSLVSYT